MPEGGGYGRFLHGKVVDMLYFPLIKTNYPDWFPFGLAGKRFEFFRPIFNIADSAISIGVVSILLFYSSYFISDKKKEEPVSVPEINPDNSDTPS